MAQIEEHTEATRLFRNYAGGYRQDGTDGSDMAAVSEGWASITPLGLRSDMLFKTRGAHGGGSYTGVSAVQERHARGCVAAAAQVVKRAAAALGMEAAGVEGVEWPVAD
jgi:hypothetical protein